MYLKKNINLERVEKVFHFLHQAGIKTLAFFMIGITLTQRDH